MLIHLDTSFLIRSLVRLSPEDIQLRQWIRAEQPLGMSAIAWAEFLCGPVGPDEADLAMSIVGAPVAFGTEAAAVAGRLFNRNGRRRGTLLDCMIAASAISAGASLATCNHADFKRLTEDGLSLWSGSIGSSSAINQL
jgi:predicted nucleic acid-binding protein